MGAFDAVIFDMDGTLIEQQIDFATLRAELGVPDGVGIIEHLAALPADRQTQANRHLLDAELAAAAKAVLYPDTRETLDRIQQAGLKTALLTRNAPEVMELILERFALRFDLTWARDQGPIKPEPDGVLRACGKLGVRPERTACVGDFRYDVVAANDAGAVSVLLTNRGVHECASLADHVIDRLSELIGILEI